MTIEKIINDEEMIKVKNTEPLTIEVQKYSLDIDGEREFSLEVDDFGIEPESWGPGCGSCSNCGSGNCGQCGNNCGSGGPGGNCQGSCQGCRR